MQKHDPIVAYFYDEELCNYNYGGGNPMRPHRVRLTNNLVRNYNLDKKLLVRRPQARSEDQITQFHADDYVEFLKTVTPDNQDEYMQQLRRFNMGAPGEADCPVFDGIFEYCALYSGGSVDGAALLGAAKADIALNWAGGMHHAKKAEASGFCYINDIVLAILELLKTYQRVLYIDIDIHHGDGVEEAFYLTDRVMTVSFHKYGDFFPGTGALGDIGTGKGGGYCVNVPLREGMDNESYRRVYEPVLTKVMEMFQPNAVVMCCGADSLSGDRLGCFNLSLEGHSNCLEFVAKYGVPMLCLGGGGYTMRNVSRCWCYETGRLAGVDLEDDIPDGALQEYHYYMDSHKLRIAVSNMRNANSREELDKIRATVLENLSRLPPVPSVQFHEPPPKQELPDEPEEEMDARGGGQLRDEGRVVKDGYGSDEEGEDGRGARRDMSHGPNEVKEEQKPVVKQEQQQQQQEEEEEQQDQQQVHSTKMEEEPAVKVKEEQQQQEQPAETEMAVEAAPPTESAPQHSKPEAAAAAVPSSAPAPQPAAPPAVHSVQLPQQQPAAAPMDVDG